MSQPLAPGSGKPVKAERTRRFAVWNRRFRICCVCFLGIVLLACMAPFGLRFYCLSLVPKSDPPPGYSDADWSPLPPQENAFTQYRLACDKVVLLPSSNSELWKMIRGGWSETSPQLKEWVSDNEAVLDDWLIGTRKPQAELYTAEETYLTIDYEAVDKLKAICALAIVVSKKKFAEGDIEKSWKLLCGAFRCSRHVGQRGVGYERLNGMTIHANAARAILLWANSPHVQIPQLDIALTTIHEDFRATARISDVYLREYEMVFHPRTLDGIREEMDAQEIVPIWKVLMYAQGEPIISKRVVSQVYANWFPEFEKPYGERPSRRPWRFGLLFDSDSPLSRRLMKLNDKPVASLAKTMLNQLAAVERSFVMEEVRQAILMAGLICEHFRRDHGRFPEQFIELSDQDRARWPTDPFSESKEPILLRTIEGETWIVSRGFDRVGETDGDFRDKVFEMELGHQLGGTP